MVITDTIEGIVDGEIRFHLDLTNDVLYLRLENRADEPTVAEETPDGALALRSQKDEALIGLTIVDFWKRTGNGKAPTETISELERRIGGLAHQLVEASADGVGTQANVRPDDGAGCGETSVCTERSAGMNEPLARYARFARKTGLPSDLSAQHDHYIHGTQKY